MCQMIFVLSFSLSRQEVLSLYKSEVGSKQWTTCYIMSEVGRKKAMYYMLYNVYHSLDSVLSTKAASKGHHECIYTNAEIML